MTKPHIKRPTAEEISAILSPSDSDPALVEIVRPAYDYLIAQLKTDRAVSDYVSNRITSELVRLSKMKGGGNHSGWKTSNEQRAANAKSRWSGVKKVKCVRIRVFDKSHEAYLAMCDNQMDRTAIASDAIIELCERANRTAMAAYCESHKGQAKKYISIREEAVSRVMEIAYELRVPYSKIVCYLLENGR